MSSPKSGVIAALTVIMSQVGVTPTALAQEAELIEQKCQQLEQISDREELQRTLEEMIQNDPSDVCLPVLLERFGPGPVASGGVLNQAY